jgi:hypothetical protein
MNPAVDNQSARRGAQRPAQRTSSSTAQAFAALSSPPGARAQYDAQRARGAIHHQALRSLSNRLIGILHGCLRHHILYDEAIAWHTDSTSQEAVGSGLTAYDRADV